MAWFSLLELSDQFAAAGAGGVAVGGHRLQAAALGAVGVRAVGAETQVLHAVNLAAAPATLPVGTQIVDPILRLSAHCLLQELPEKGREPFVLASGAVAPAR
jgi:hypothetical protein